MNFHITWSKLGVIAGLITALQGAGYFVNRSNDNAVVLQRINDISDRVGRIELCLLEQQCGRASAALETATPHRP